MSASEVMFKDFATLAKRRGHTAESLAARFRGKIENAGEFCERVMAGRWKGEDMRGSIVPYRSAIDFYRQELRYFQDSNPKHKACACGCGAPVFDRKRWATPGCRQRVARGKVADMQKGGVQVSEIVEAKL